MTVRIAIDLNVRVRGRQTYAGFEDVREGRGFSRARTSAVNGPVEVGDKVLAVEPEDRIVADAVVVDIDEERQLVYLSVDWQGFRDDPEAADDPACE